MINSLKLSGEERYKLYEDGDYYYNCCKGGEHYYYEEDLYNYEEEEFYYYEDDYICSVGDDNVNEEGDNEGGFVFLHDCLQGDGKGALECKDGIGMNCGAEDTDYFFASSQLI
ncbi:MAG: hypothetical protein EZS28_012369 [Streblomastix strix]|uniref:Uncharacterized protein n=1 Tax=Streblomastix strix TaxID=222440 RepID=A0A5J4WAV6_9EUKA|nr:MAG: hypothetical protein EZS28_012369 [Streblomastix strix]